MIKSRAEEFSKADRLRINPAVNVTDSFYCERSDSLFSGVPFLMIPKTALLRVRLNQPLKI